MTRRSSLSRKTEETEIGIELDLDRPGTEIRTPVGFFNHMLELLAVHGGFGLAVTAEGDTDVDDHHTVEDVGIVFGQALREALADRKGIRRYGQMLLPMDEVLVLAAVDLGGRPHLELKADLDGMRCGTFETGLIYAFWRAAVNHGFLNLHIRMLASGDPHHMAEAIFKAAGRALGQAMRRDGGGAVPSTKGVLD